MLILSGKKWQERRKIANTAFHYNVLQEYFQTFVVKTNNFIQVLRAEADTNEITKELEPITTSVAIKIICGKQYSTQPYYYTRLHIFNNI